MRRRVSVTFIVSSDRKPGVPEEEEPFVEQPLRIIAGIQLEPHHDPRRPVRIIPDCEERHRGRGDDVHLLLKLDGDAAGQ